MNPYLNILEDNFDKLVNLFNRDIHSSSYGYADRLNWGWKISDFSNATLQGAVHSLAVGLRLSDKFKKHEEPLLEIIKAAIRACKSISAKNGSLQEAYPNENSFCVTALVAFDILSALDILENKLDSEFHAEALEVVEPMIAFISKHNEEHALISNHLATAVAAIAIWNKRSNSNNKRHQELLEIIYSNQSAEGWYKEYESADPGYQTLCTYYLAAAYDNLKDDKLLASIQKSLNFLQYFVHPNGTIGGSYGSRNTEVYYPGGIVFMQSTLPEYGWMSNSFLKGIKNGENLLPQHIDIGNYVPLLNSYAFAALYFHDQSDGTCPFDTFELDFPESGLYSKKTSAYHAILNYKKGGVIRVYDNSNGELDYSDDAYFGQLSSGIRFSNQGFQAGGQFKDQKIESGFYRLNPSKPGPFSTVILRLLALTMFRSVGFGNWFKKRIVSMLMTTNKSVGGKVVRLINFEEDIIQIKDEIDKPSNTKTLVLSNNSRSIHMASSGYFLNQHFSRSKKSKFVSLKVK